MRLLQVLEPSGGGSGRHFIDLCAGLARRGHAITAVYSPVRAEARFVDELTALGLTSVIPLPMQRAVGPHDVPAWRGLRAIIRRHGPFDIIHGHSSKAGALTRLRPPGPHVPRVYTPHAFRTLDPTLGGKGRLLYGTVEGLLGRFLSDRVICVSLEEYDHALALGIPAARLRVVVNGVARPPEDGRERLRARFGIPPDAVLFGFVGRLSAQKAPERLLEAFGLIAAETPRAFLLMIGFGELEPDMRRWIAAADLGGRIVVTEEIPGVKAIQCFDVLVQPSRYEAMSYVMLEAAAGGKPMILTDVGGAATVLEPGRNGLLVPNSDDPAPLAAAMRALVDENKRAAFTGEALARRDRYGVDLMVEETLSVYRDLVGG